MESGKNIVTFVVETCDEHYLSSVFKDTIDTPESFVGRMLT